MAQSKDYLSLPISLAVTLGIELTAIISVEYADGRRSQELVFSVEVDLDGKRGIVPATLTAGAEALIGTALLEKYELRINFPLQRIKLQKNLILFKEKRSVKNCFAILTLLSRFPI